MVGTCDYQKELYSGGPAETLLPSGPVVVANGRVNQ